MSGLFVGAIIGGALLALWWVTAHIGRRHRFRTDHFAMNHENEQLRHTITEMAMERHHREHQKPGR